MCLCIPSAYRATTSVSAAYVRVDACPLHFVKAITVNCNLLLLCGCMCKLDI